LKDKPAPAHDAKKEKGKKASPQEDLLGGVNKAEQKKKGDGSSEKKKKEKRRDRGLGKKRSGPTSFFGGPGQIARKSCYSNRIGKAAELDVLGGKTSDLAGQTRKK